MGFNSGFKGLVHPQLIEKPSVRWGSNVQRRVFIYSFM